EGAFDHVVDRGVVAQPGGQLLGAEQRTKNLCDDLRLGQSKLVVAHGQQRLGGSFDPRPASRVERVRRAGYRARRDAGDGDRHNLEVDEGLGNSELDQQQRSAPGVRNTDTVLIDVRRNVSQVRFHFSYPPLLRVLFNDAGWVSLSTRTNSERGLAGSTAPVTVDHGANGFFRSEEHTSELQSRF